MSNPEYVFVFSLVVGESSMEGLSEEIQTAVGSLSIVYRAYPSCASVREWFRDLYKSGELDINGLRSLMAISIPSEEVAVMASVDGNTGMTALVDDGLHLIIERCEIR